MNNLIKIGDKTYKECMVIMLPTTQETNITKSITSGYLYHSSTLEKARLHFKHEGATYQHLYIVSSEKIKEGWIIGLDDKIHYVNEAGTYPKVIIASTDSSIIYIKGTKIGEQDLLPRPSDDFIKKYCELNGDIKDVLVEYEELCSNIMMNMSRISGVKVASNNTISIIKKSENQWDINWKFIQENFGEIPKDWDNGDLFMFVMQNYKLVK